MTGGSNSTSTPSGQLSCTLSYNSHDVCYSQSSSKTACGIKIYCKGLDVYVDVARLKGKFMKQKTVFFVGFVAISIFTIAVFYKVLFSHNDAEEIYQLKKQSDDTNVTRKELVSTDSKGITNAAGGRDKTDKSKEYQSNTPEISDIQVKQIIDINLFGVFSHDETSILKGAKLELSEAELEMLDENSVSLLSRTLFDSRVGESQFGSEVNVTAISMATFAYNFHRLENAIRFYIPEYRIGQPFPKDKSWPNGERPPLIKEILIDLNFSQASIDKETAVGKLINAKFAELNTYRLTELELKTSMLSAFDTSSEKQLTALEEYFLSRLNEYLNEHYD